MKTRLTVFGTMQYIQTKFAGEKNSPVYLGGNAIIASLAAARHVSVDIIGVIGTDLKKSLLTKSLGKKINTKSVEQYKGKTFQYKAIYSPKTFEILRHEIQFGVYGEYKPKLSAHDSKHIKLILFSGSKPQYNLQILQQLKNKPIIAVTTLFYHLQHNFAYSKQLIQHATYLFTNEREYRLLKKLLGNLFSVAKNLVYIFVTKGEKGVILYTRDISLSFPSVKPIAPLNPTNAGDAFAGTVMGMIAKGYTIEKQVHILVSRAQIECMKVLKNDAYYRKSGGLPI